MGSFVRLPGATVSRVGHEVPIDLGSNSILFSDAHLVAVDKAPGVLCDATIDPNREHLGTALRRWALENEASAEDPPTEESEPEFHPAHRLDRCASGVVLFARDRVAATALMNQFRDRSVNKHYQAVVRLPVDQTWVVGRAFERRSYLRHRRGKTEEVRSGGKPSESKFEVLEIDGRLALVHASPKTGRTHQLRVHLAALGAPIVGDDLYGPSDRAHRPDAEPTRLWLHSDGLEVTHPISETPLVLRSRLNLRLVAGQPMATARPG